MKTSSSSLRWGVEQRLEFIEFRLFWEGVVNRADITSYFGVSVPQASLDLAKYLELAPKNLSYDRSGKRYVASTDFRPIFMSPDADQYLGQIALSDTTASSREHALISSPPTADAVPIPFRRVDANVLKAILSAIRAEESLEVLYQSMSNDRPEPTWRRISPHAFGHDGLRWHVRGYCHIDGRFKDFVLSRCTGTRNPGDAGANPRSDSAWNEIFEAKLVPNPKLTKSQQAVIALDYGMKHGQLVIPIRRALLYYFQKRLRLDVAEQLDNPQETPVIILNIDDLANAMDSPI